MKKAALFDLDGVVVFTDQYHYLAWKKLADEEEWCFDEVVNNGCRGVPRMESLEVILRHNKLEFSESEKLAFADRKNRYYVELLKDMDEKALLPGVVPFIKELRSLGLLTGLCSSSRNADLVLKSLCLTEYFETIVTGNDIENAKPHPEIFLKGAKGVGVAPEDCIVFEDAPSGIAAATAAGMSSVGVGDPELLQDAMNVIRDYAEFQMEWLGLGHVPECEG